MDEVAKTSRPERSIAVAAMVLVGAAGCGSSGGSKSSPPKFGEPRMACANVEDDDLDRKVLREISVEVSDPDEDLVLENGQICGTVNGLPVAFGDSDGDRIFTWKASKKLKNNPCRGDIRVAKNRIICSGTFTITATARDTDGNRGRLETKIEKGGSQ